MRSKNRFNWIILGWTLGLLSIPGCLKERIETPTKGNLTVVVSESVFPLLKLEEQRFEDLYPQAHLELIPTTAREAVTRLFNDTIRLIVISRPMNAEEMEIAKKYKLDIAEYKIAIDGIAILVNEENPVSRLRTTELDSILSGEITRWSEVGGKDSKIQLCLPDPNSGNFEVIGRKILRGRKYAVPEKVAGGSEDMLRFVAGRPDAVGMIGLNWLGAKGDRIKIVELSDPDAPDSLGIRDQYFAPYQAHVYRRYYPLTREVFIYSRLDMYSVGAGFISFITSVPGQQIVLNSGLVPATMPIRLVELTNKDIKP